MWMSNIPTTLKTKLEHGVRTAYGFGLVCLLFNYWKWAGSMTFFSTVITLIAHSLYVGQWISSSVTGIIASIVGVILGTLASMAWKVGSDGSLQLFLMFISLTIINRISVWDRYSKILGTLSCFIITLLPNLLMITQIEINVANSIETGLLIVVVPIIITGLAIMFPVPGTASKKSVQVMIQLNKNATLVLTNLIQAFYDLDVIEIYLTQNEVLFQDIDSSVELLSSLYRLSKYENSILFIRNLTPILSIYINLIKKLVDDLKSLQIAMSCVPINITQLKFAQHMKESLNEINSAVQIILTQVLNKYIALADFDVYSLNYWFNMCSNKVAISYNKHTDMCNSRHCLHRQRSEATDPVSNQPHSSSDRRPDSNHIDNLNNNNASSVPVPILADTFEGDCVCQYYDVYKRAMCNIQVCKSKILFEYQNVRQRYVYDDTFMSSSSSLQTNKPNTTIATTVTPAANTRGEVKSLSRHQTAGIKKTDLSYLNSNINNNSNNTDDHEQKGTSYKEEIKNSIHQSRSSSQSQSRNMSILHKVSMKSNKALLNNLTPSPSPSAESSLPLLSVTASASHDNNDMNSTDANVNNAMEILEMDEQTIRSIIHYENDHLAIRNLSVRCGYISRLFSLIRVLDEEVTPLFTATTPVFSCKEYSLAVLMSLYEYFAWFFKLESYTDQYFLLSLVQPMKIAGSITLTSVLVVNSSLTVNDGLFAGATLCVIRQDSSASSFLTSYQRLEGMYAYMFVD